MIELAKFYEFAAKAKAGTLTAEDLPKIDEAAREAGLIRDESEPDKEGK